MHGIGSRWRLTPGSRLIHQGESTLTKEALGHPDICRSVRLEPGAGTGRQGGWRVLSRKPWRSRCSGEGEGHLSRGGQVRRGWENHQGGQRGPEGG